MPVTFPRPLVPILPFITYLQAAGLTPVLALEMWLVVMIGALIVRIRRCLAVELSDAFMRFFLLFMARGKPGVAVG